MSRPSGNNLLIPLLCSFFSGNLIYGHESSLHAYELAVLSSAGRAAGSPCEMTQIEPCRTRVRLLDEETGRSVAGLLRVRADAGCEVPLDPLLNRGTELAADNQGRLWWVLLETTTIALPRTTVTIEAFSGLETEIARETFDLREECPEQVAIPIRRFYDAGQNDWHSGNTHLHVRNLTRQASDQYLTSIPRGDDLDLVFVSYLERVEDDKTYISNEYEAADLRELSSPELDLAWGEELRHYFGPYGEGYGHVLLLNLRELVRPVSIGPRLTGSGDDSIPVRQGMNESRRQGASVVWCHNSFGFEDIPNWLDRIIDAQNIFDGGSEGSYEDSFYQYLNIGLHVPFSTGTDWFMYDFSRVYVNFDHPPSVNEWLEALGAGRSFITNGTFLEFSVGSRLPGDLVELSAPLNLPVAAQAVGRNDFGVLELVYNGRIVEQVPSRKLADHYEAKLETSLRIEEPGWLATRIADGEKNEMGQPLFAHTSPIYVEVSGERIFDPRAARRLIQEMEEAVETIPTKAIFSEPTQWETIRRIYEQGIRYLEESLTRSR